VAGFDEQSMNEAVGPSGRGGKCPHAFTSLVPLAEVHSQIITLRSGDPCTLLQFNHPVRPPTSTFNLIPTNALAG
jgi:hypothetical protein